MSTKQLHLLISLSFILFCFLQNANAETVYVDASNNTGIEDGSEEHPFNTIKEGISAAVPADTVFIRQGTYSPDEAWEGHDNALMLKAGVQLIGEGADVTIINGYIIDTATSNLPIGLTELTLIEFHFSRATVTGPFTDQNIISRCNAAMIRIAHGGGIPVNDTTPGPTFGFIIEANDLGNEGIIEFGQGWGASENSILNNKCGIISIRSAGGYTYLIDGNEVEQGIEDGSGMNNVTISHNDLNGPIIDKSAGSNNGIENEFIENNTISCNGDSPLFEDENLKAGILAFSGSVTIRNNTINCSGNVSGIRAGSGAPFHVISNEITIDEVSQPDPNPEEGTIGLYNVSAWGYVTGNIIYGGGVGYYSIAGTKEFADNEIRRAYTGVYSQGDEIMHHNIIEECYGDGMILLVKGPVYNNIIRNNGGSGIMIKRPGIDLGGGDDASPGCNIITGNGNYNLFIATTSTQFPVLYARYNVWDHTVADEISQYDIWDENDSEGLLTVDFVPFGYLAVDDIDLAGNMCIYPNPAREAFKVRSLKFKVGRATVELFGPDGRKLLEVQIPKGSDEITVNVRGLKSGLYFCRITVANKSVTKKVIIQKSKNQSHT
ncbi:MAG: T9SS type A sorting domain-containing protein [Chlorobi bacterium]|nr:T9SS type A sorting domain-containing protein [Chlorobiota bacterium]